jgi:hypothetical protein
VHATRSKRQLQKSRCSACTIQTGLNHRRSIMRQQGEKLVHNAQGRGKRRAINNYSRPDMMLLVVSWELWMRKGGFGLLDIQHFGCGRWLVGLQAGRRAEEEEEEKNGLEGGDARVFMGWATGGLGRRRIVDAAATAGSNNEQADRQTGRKGMEGTDRFGREGGSERGRDAGRESGWAFAE